MAPGNPVTEYHPLLIVKLASGLQQIMISFKVYNKLQLVATLNDRLYKL